ncbi:MAG TPA: hypothetical protein VJQ55_11115 [Candidatus Binatia bacterium]|nr:hypothetical protein [Candidatus Binatia bacterium]
MKLIQRGLLFISILIFIFPAFDRAGAQSPDPKTIEGAKKEGQMVF